MRSDCARIADADNILIIIIIIIIIIIGRCHSVVESSSTHRQRSYSK